MFRLSKLFIKRDRPLSKVQALTKLVNVKDRLSKIIKGSKDLLAFIVNIKEVIMIRPSAYIMLV